MEAFFEIFRIINRTFFVNELPDIYNFAKGGEMESNFSEAVVSTIKIHYPCIEPTDGNRNPLIIFRFKNFSHFPSFTRS